MCNLTKCHGYCESMITVVRANSEFLCVCFCRVADPNTHTLNWETIHTTILILYARIHIPPCHVTVFFRRARLIFGSSYSINFLFHLLSEKETFKHH